VSPFALFCHPVRRLACALLLGLTAGAAGAAGATVGTSSKPVASPTAKAPAPPIAGEAKNPAPTHDPGIVVDRIRAALAQHPEKSRMQVLVGDQPLTSLSPSGQTVTPPPPKPRARPRAKTTAQPSAAGPALPADEPRWAYTGAHGPEHWGQIRPAYSACASGLRQAPIRIDTRQTLQGPAEPLQLAYASSGGRVAHTGQTLWVDVAGQNTLTVRGSTFQLEHLQFHHPAEIRIDDKTHAMAVHLLHRNEQGQMAMLVVLLETGQPHPEIDKIWTHMPLEVNDSVPMPTGGMDLRALLPTDARYYQFMGSLNTPPCTEGVLWLVMKQPMTISPEQLRLFAQLFPMNARPVQALHGRVVREGM
jgi:carbonic anhydrase